jgi:hypothetical protein
VDVATAPGVWQSIAIADLNGDGKPDIAVTAADGNVSVLLGNGDGTFQPYVTHSTGATSTNYLAVGDVNGDGKLDIVAGNSFPSPSVSVLLGKGDGTFLDPVDYSLLYNPNWVVLGDFNKDGHLDIATSAQKMSSGRVTVLLNNGDGTFPRDRNFRYGQDRYGRYPQKMLTADLNRDGNLDIVAVDTSDGGVMLGSRRGALTYQDTTIGLVATDLALGDFNGDGLWDLAGPDFAYRRVGVAVGDGTGAFTTVVAPIGSYTEDVAVADFNGDGKDDIVATRSGIAEILMGNGDVTFQSPVDYSVAPTNRFVTTGDLNLDGAPDIVTINCSDSTLSVLLNNGGTYLTLTSSANPSGAGQPVTFTLAVGPSFSDVGTPGGMVKFLDGAVVLGNVPLQAGEASFTTSTLMQGSHTIRAVYSGDSTFNRHRSSLISQEVQ